jgi:hypothetical protein
MEASEWGWPRNSPISGPAREFTRFRRTGTLRTIGLGIAPEISDQVLEEHPAFPPRRIWVPQHDDAPAPATRPRRCRVRIRTPGRRSRGGDFHSSHCNYLEPLMHDQLNIGVNRHSLIDDLEASRNAVEFISRPEVPAEPVSWIPTVAIGAVLVDPADELQGQRPTAVETPARTANPWR